jgi:hypothetical protein
MRITLSNETMKRVVEFEKAYTEMGVALREGRTDAMVSAQERMNTAARMIACHVMVGVSMLDATDVPEVTS